MNNDFIIPYSLDISITEARLAQHEWYRPYAVFMQDSRVKGIRLVLFQLYKGPKLEKSNSMLSSNELWQLQAGTTWWRLVETLGEGLDVGYTYNSQELWENGWRFFDRPTAIDWQTFEETSTTS